MFLIWRGAITNTVSCASSNAWTTGPSGRYRHLDVPGTMQPDDQAAQLRCGVRDAEPPSR